MKRSLLLVLLLVGARCSSAPAPAGGAGGTAAPMPGKTPFSAPPAAAHDIRISIDATAAREILASLARPRFQMSDAQVLQDMLPIQLAIKDSGRTEEVFQRDFAAAWDPESRTAVFDFATIRRERERWEVLLAAVTAGKGQLEEDARRRVAALLPGDRVVVAKVRVDISFGLAGLADHLTAAAPNGDPVIVIDLARALGEAEAGPAQNQITRLVRLIAGETYREAWEAYREANPAWSRPLPGLGPLEPLVRTVAEAGPVAIFGVEDSFFPLSTWLKEPMQRSLNDMNRMGERLIESESDLDTRVSLAGELKRPDFRRRVASPGGAFMEDGIIQVFGIEGLRQTLSEGPVAFFQEYDRAAKQLKDLPPLSKVIVERLGAAPATPK
jgi:hypothetical protein